MLIYYFLYIITTFTFLLCRQKFELSLIKKIGNKPIKTKLIVYSKEDIATYYHLVNLGKLHVPIENYLIPIIHNDYDELQFLGEEDIDPEDLNETLDETDKKNFKELIDSIVLSYKYSWENYQTFLDKIDYSFQANYSLFTFNYYQKDDMHIVKSIFYDLLDHVRILTIFEKKYHLLRNLIRFDLLNIKAIDPVLFNSLPIKYFLNYNLENLISDEHEVFQRKIKDRINDQEVLISPEGRKEFLDYFNLAFKYNFTNLIDPVLYIKYKNATLHILKEDEEKWHPIRHHKFNNLLKNEKQRLEKLFEPSEEFIRVIHLSYYIYEDEYRDYKNDGLYYFVKHTYKSIVNFRHTIPVDSRYELVSFESDLDNYDIIDYCVYVYFIAQKLNTNIKNIQIEDGIDYMDCYNIKNKYSDLFKIQNNQDLYEARYEDKADEFKLFFNL